MLGFLHLWRGEAYFLADSIAPACYSWSLDLGWMSWKEEWVLFYRNCFCLGGIALYVWLGKIVGASSHEYIKELTL